MPVLSEIPRDRLDAMLEAVDVGIWYCDLPFDELTWDARVKEHFWLPPDARVTIEDFYAGLHPEDRARTRATIEQAIAEGNPYDIEYRTCPPGAPAGEGPYRWIRAIGYTRYDEAGAPIRFDGITVDITPQKRQELAHAASEERFRVMADNAPVMIWVTRPDGACTYLSAKWYEFTGQRPEEALGFGWLDAVHPDDRERSAEAFRTANERRESFELDYRLRRHDGEYRWAVDSAAPHIGAEGEFLGYVGSVIEIHERKEGEQERERLLAAEREARADAEHANRVKSQFLAVMSHELRTPLNAILGYTDLMRGGVGGEPSAAQERHLAGISKSGRVLLDLIDGVLTYARVEAGRERIEVAPVNLSELIGTTLDMIRPQADAKGIRLVDRSEGIGTVRTDARKLRQVLINLVSNGVKFTREGQVTVDAERRGGHVRVVVEDTGVGVPEDARSTIFEPFTQLDQSHTRTAGGTGLGLAIARSFARMMGGDIEVESHGRGSRFVVILPG